jgi:hypothetical protein
MTETFTDGTTSGVVTKDVTPGLGVKIIQVRVPATFVWGTDLLVVDLKDYGASKCAGVLGFVETTEGSVTVPCGAAGTQLGTTAVASGVLTYTSVGAAANTKGGTLVIFAY